MSSPSGVTVDALLRQAATLSTDERWLLLERLELMQEKGHRPPPGSHKSADEWIDTLRRRATEMQEGAARTVSLDEAVDEARRRIQ